MFPLREPKDNWKQAMQLRDFEWMLLPFDLVSLAMAWYLTIYLRILLNPLFVKQLSYNDLVYVAPPLGGVLVLWTITRLLLQRGQKQDSSLGTSLLEVAEATLTAGLLTIAVTFFSRNLGSDLSRS